MILILYDFLRLRLAHVAPSLLRPNPSPLPAPPPSPWSLSLLPSREGTFGGRGPLRRDGYYEWIAVAQASPRITKSGPNTFDFVIVETFQVNAHFAKFTKTQKYMFYPVWPNTNFYVYGYGYDYGYGYVYGCGYGYDYGYGYGHCSRLWLRLRLCLWLWFTLWSRLR